MTDLPPQRPGTVTAASALMFVVPGMFFVRGALDGLAVILIENALQADPTAATVPRLSVASPLLSTAIIIMVAAMRGLAKAIRRGVGAARVATWVLLGVGLADVLRLVTISPIPTRLSLDLPGLGGLVPAWYPLFDTVWPIALTVLYAAIVLLLAAPATNAFFRRARRNAAEDSPVPTVSAQTTGARAGWRWILEHARVPAVRAIGVVLAVVAIVAVTLAHRAEPAKPRCVRSYDYLTHAAAFSPDGKILAVGVSAKYPARGAVRLWNPATGRPLGRPLTGDGAGVEAVAFSPDGKVLAAGGDDGTVRLWDPTTGRPLGQPLAGHGRDRDGAATVHSVAFSPDGKVLATGGGTVRLWNPATGQPIDDPFPDTTAGDASVEAVAFSPDGTTLAVVSWANRSGGDLAATVQLWDLTTGLPSGQFVADRTTEDARAPAVAFSPDGKVLATASGDGAVRLWDATGGRPLGRLLAGHGAGVEAVAFSPDGKVLAAGGDDGTVRLWDPTTGRTLGRPLTKPEQAWRLAFSPNGTLLAVNDRDQVCLLDMPARASGDR